jgi:hypothetical protein
LPKTAAVDLKPQTTLKQGLKMKPFFRHLARMDIPGGGQVVADRSHIYIGHMRPPLGTSIVDVSDPKRPRLAATVELPSHTHSHKVRVRGDIMMVNQEINRPEPTTAVVGNAAKTVQEQERQARESGFRGGLKIYDISDRTKPRAIGLYPSNGVHRFDSDDRYAYISSQEDGFLGDIVVIVDLSDPANPKRVSRWWMPGQWLEGGEKPTWPARRHRCHHPLRMGDRLYVSYWHGGFVILDISDLTKPIYVGGFDTSPPYPNPTHTTLPIPQTLMGRRLLMVVDEEVADRLTPTPNAFAWMVDITDETHPIPVSTFGVTHDRPFDNECWYGAHQPQEVVDGNIISITWFAGGLRAVDISDPYRPTEVGSFMPTPEPGRIVQSNDIYYDKSRGLYFLLDRHHGLDILERVG